MYRSHMVVTLNRNIKKRIAMRSNIRPNVSLSQDIWSLVSRLKLALFSFLDVVNIYTKFLRIPSSGPRVTGHEMTLTPKSDLDIEASRLNMHSTHVSKYFERFKNYRVDTKLLADRQTGRRTYERTGGRTPGV